MGQLKVEKERLSGALVLTALVVMGITLYIAFYLWNIVGMRYGTAQLPAWTSAQGGFFFLFVMMFFHALITKAAPRLKMSLIQIVVIYSFIMSGSCVWMLPALWTIVPTWTVYYAEFRVKMGHYVPIWWSPSDPRLVEGFFYGGQMDVGAWFPVLFWFITYSVSFALLQFAVGLIWKERWIDQERLEFPYATVALDMMRAGGIKGFEAIPKVGGILSPFWLGTLVSVLFALPQFVFGWGATEIPSFLQQLYHGYDASTYNMLIPLNFNITWIGLAFLMPLSISLTITLYWIIGFILVPGILTYTGVIPLRPVQSWYDNFWQTGGGILENLPAFGQIMWFAYPVLLFAMNWKYIAKTFRAKAEGDEDAIPTRKMWILAGVCVVVMLVLLLLAGLGALGSIYTVIVWTLPFLSLVRLRATTGFMTCFYYWGPELWNQGLTWPSLPYLASGTQNSTECYTTMYMGAMLGDCMTYAGYGGGALFESVHLAERAKIRIRDMLSPLIVGTVVFMALGYVIYVANGFAVGAVNTCCAMGNRSGYNESFLATIESGIPYWHEPWGMDVAGIVAMVIIGILQVRLPWFPIRVEGIMLGTSFMVGPCIFVAYPIAWLLKTLIIKMAGIEVYEKTARPFFTGLFIAGFFCIWIAYMGYRSWPPLVFGW